MNRKLTVIEALTRISDGGALEDLKNAIADVSAAVEDGGTKAKGKVTLELAIERYGSGQIIVRDKVKTVKPPVLKDPTMFFVDQDGGLSREDPNQFRLSEEVVK